MNNYITPARSISLRPEDNHGLLVEFPTELLIDIEQWLHFDQHNLDTPSLEMSAIPPYVNPREDPFDSNLMSNNINNDGFLNAISSRDSLNTEPFYA